MGSWGCDAGGVGRANPGARGPSAAHVLESRGMRGRADVR